MKKIYLSITLATFLLFSGCSITNSKTESTVSINNSNLDAVVKESSITQSETDIILDIKNNTDDKWNSETDFTLEVEDGGEWYQVPFKKSEHPSTEQIYLEKNASSSFVIKLSNYFDHLDEGNYRIVLSLTNDEGNVNNVSAQFKITNNPS